MKKEDELMRAREANGCVQSTEVSSVSRKSERERYRLGLPGPLLATDPELSLSKTDGFRTDGRLRQCEQQKCLWTIFSGYFLTTSTEIPDSGMASLTLFVLITIDDVHY